MTNTFKTYSLASLFVIGLLTFTSCEKKDDEVVTKTTNSASGICNGLGMEVQFQVEDNSLQMDSVDVVLNEDQTANSIAISSKNTSNENLLIVCNSQLKAFFKYNISGFGYSNGKQLPILPSSKSVTTSSTHVKIVFSK